MNQSFENIDRAIIGIFRSFSMPVARLALFIVFFWFGILKLVDASPANPLVSELLSATMPFITFSQFIVGLGIYEMLIGLAFIVPRMERLAIFLLLPHIFVTAMPLFLLPEITWQSSFIPTLEGQYIIKNVLIVALAATIAAHLEPIRRKG